MQPEWSMVSWSMAVPMKKKPKHSALKAVRRRTGHARAGTKPDQAGRVKRAKARPKSPPRAAPADPKLTIRRLRSELARARSRIEQLEDAADQDFLLDIPNRRGFERELGRAIAYIKRYQASGALIVLDVDRLKPINDAYGHAAGDKVLKAIVAVLSRPIRSPDVSGRLGGDEFALLLWNLSETDARPKAAALEQAIDALSFSFDGGNVSAGASAGIPILRPHAEAGKALGADDSAMYVRKAQ